MNELTTNINRCHFMILVISLVAMFFWISCLLIIFIFTSRGLILLLPFGFCLWIIYGYNIEFRDLVNSIPDKPHIYEYPIYKKNYDMYKDKQ